MIEAAVQEEVAVISGDISGQFMNAVVVLQRKAKRWENCGRVPKEEWLEDARFYSAIMLDITDAKTTN